VGKEFISSSIANGHLAVWKSFFRSMWKDFDTKFGGILERLGRHRKYVESCADVAHFQQSRKDLLEFRKDNDVLHQQAQNDLSDLRTTNLTQHQSTQDDIARAHTDNLAQHRRTQEVMAQASVTHLAHHQKIQDDIGQAEDRNTAQHQDTHDGIARLEAMALTRFKTHELDMAVLKSTTHTTQMNSQKHASDLARMDANNAARHRAYADDMLRLSSKLDGMIAEEQRRKMETVKEWLAVGQQNSVLHASYRQVRLEHPNTAKWILKQEAVNNWLASHPPATPSLWINGIPGAGMSLSRDARGTQAHVCRENHSGVCYS
jgi:hypothetical protein